MTIRKKMNGSSSPLEQIKENVHASKTEIQLWHYSISRGLSMPKYRHSKEHIMTFIRLTLASLFQLVSVLCRCRGNTPKKNCTRVIKSLNNTKMDAKETTCSNETKFCHDQFSTSSVSFLVGMWFNFWIFSLKNQSHSVEIDLVKIERFFLNPN